MALERAIARFRSASALARRMGVTYQAIQGWKTAGVPIERCAELETLVAGQVQCEELNEDWPRITLRPFRKADR
jgi:DNA-binding transcriptional regulator YdaS (Cro superfamily)